MEEPVFGGVFFFGVGLVVTAIVGILGTWKFNNMMLMYFCLTTLVLAGTIGSIWFASSNQEVAMAKVEAKAEANWVKFYGKLPAKAKAKFEGNAKYKGCDTKYSDVSDPSSAGPAAAAAARAAGPAGPAAGPAGADPFPSSSGLLRGGEGGHPGRHVQDRRAHRRRRALPSGT